MIAPSALDETEAFIIDDFLQREKCKALYEKLSGSEYKLTESASVETEG